MDKVYKSKLDWWLAVALLLPLIGVGAALYTGLRVDRGVLWVAFAAGGVMLLVYAGLIFPMRYTIGADGLGVRAGLLLRFFVPWDRLVGARFTRSPWSSPALSLQRIHIDYTKPNGKQVWVMISPADRAGFLADLASASGKHKVDGERLVRLP